MKKGAPPRKSASKDKVDTWELKGDRASRNPPEEVPLLDPNEEELPEEVRVGRPSKYNPIRFPPWARGLAAGGMTVPKIAQAMGISRNTLYAYARAHPEFLAALQVGRSEVVAEIKLALIRRAKGYEIITKEREVRKVGRKTHQRIVEREVHIPPDPGAAMKLLVNLDPDWKDRTALEVTGAGGRPLEAAIVILPQKDVAPGALPNGNNKNNKKETKRR